MSLKFRTPRNTTLNLENLILKNCKMNQNKPNIHTVPSTLWFLQCVPSEALDPLAPCIGLQRVLATLKMPPSFKYSSALPPASFLPVFRTLYCVLLVGQARYVISSPEKNQNNQTSHLFRADESSSACQFQTNSCSGCPEYPHYLLALHEQCETQGTVPVCDLSWEVSVGHLLGQIHFLASCFLKNSMTSGDCKIC
ncbi:hypothetical protein E2C01_014911 [Portunus trituberculatus]|uniref:Uncharacterized protein n=1 Tax=Portunus trituberculatus TaxID=210409 RepID=A0A5B7DKE9_PORTR|nr:hypothetical protein [Portunus trituberculatus]